MSQPEVGSQNDIENFGIDNHWSQQLYDWHPVNEVNRNEAHTTNQLPLRRTPANNDFDQNQMPQRRQDSGSAIRLLSFSEVRRYFQRVPT